MNPLFCEPIHGIACAPYCDPQTAQLPYQLNVENGSIALGAALKPIWSMQDEGQRYTTQVALYQPESETLLLKVDCQGKGVFRFKANTLTIDWQDEGTDAAHYFQTLGVALWLELNNVLCIHANALAYGDAAIALVAPSRGGKTTLSAALCQQGFALMTDDMMALHRMPGQKNDNDSPGYKIYPSWPVARMWPNSLSYLQANNEQQVGANEQGEQYQKVHQQFAKRQVKVNKQAGFNFCPKAKPLKVIYLLNRLSPTEYQAFLAQDHGLGQGQNNSSGIWDIRPVPAARALMLLLQNSILGDAYRALNIEGPRIKALALLLQTVQFKQVSYLSGSEHLQSISKAIRQDCQG